MNPDIFSEYPDVVNVDDLKAMLGIGKNVAYRLVNDNIIQSIRIGKIHKIPKCKVIEFLRLN